MGGSFCSTPAVTSVGGQLSLWALGTDRRMYHKWWDGKNWGPNYNGWWQDMGGSFSSIPVVVCRDAGHTDIFGLGTDNTILHKVWEVNVWKPGITEWDSQGGYSYSAPFVTSWGPSRLDVFNVGVPNGDAQHRAWNGYAWGSSSGAGWDSLGGRFQLIE